ncbi:17619_t:CDS:2 [Acaulospora colombiana]|uniref:17619_t:CDS:1 n=1 Tax=Acaulospora colombiana TaxID=27376 RepID=A0ACA9KRT5_9GLOM|nr:17619_t:CDS:2 [Acaulospora colombiana]
MADYMFTLSSLIAVILCVIPGIFHIQTRNWGAIFMTFWVIAINGITFINSLLWANDLDDKALFPAIGTALFYLVQTNIYGIRPVLGCFSPAHKDWVFIAIDAIWPSIISGIGCYYAARTSYAIIKKRLELQSILQYTDGLNTAKFYRLVFFCITFLLLSFPTSVMTLFSNLTLNIEPYDFYTIHENFWVVQRFVGANLGVSFIDYAKPLVGFFVFLFFGTGQDALATYANWARACKLNVCFKCLEPGEFHDRDGFYSTTASMRSFPSRSYQSNSNMAIHSPKFAKASRRSSTFSNSVAPPAATAQKQKGAFDFLYVNGHRTPTEQAQFDLTSGIKIRIDGLDNRTMGNVSNDYDDLNEEPAPIYQQRDYNRGIHETLEGYVCGGLHDITEGMVLNDSDTFGPLNSSASSLKDHDLSSLSQKGFYADVSHINDFLSVYPNVELEGESDKVGLPEVNICPPTPMQGSYENNVLSPNCEIETFVINGLDDVEDRRRIRNSVEIQVKFESVVSVEDTSAAP